MLSVETASVPSCTLITVSDLFVLNTDLITGHMLATMAIHVELRCYVTYTQTPQLCTCTVDIHVISVPNAQSETRKFGTHNGNGTEVLLYLPYHNAKETRKSIIIIVRC